MKTFIQFKYANLFGIIIRFPWFASPAPSFQLAGNTIRVTNHAKHVIGLKNISSLENL